VLSLEESRAVICRRSCFTLSPRFYSGNIIATNCAFPSGVQLSKDTCFPCFSMVLMNFGTSASLASLVASDSSSASCTPVPVLAIVLRDLFVCLWLTRFSVAVAAAAAPSPPAVAVSPVAAAVAVAASAAASAPTSLFVYPIYIFG
jgi:hypothetical protein